MEQRPFAFTKETFVEMLDTIRARTKDNKVIYLFVDNAGYHSKGIVDEAYERLNIVPVFNIAY